MTIKQRRDNEARRLTAALFNALAIAGVASAIFSPYGVNPHLPIVEIAIRIAYLLGAVYMHLCGQVAIQRIEDERQ